ncbi:MAG: phosphotransferase [Methanosarcinaceae archaeon]|nr:phosphotransferase [Methanosarcinaceae archaeon]MDD4748926.1 phosphotransferase [Methanosarcinaceae archaeon]
MAQYHVNTLTPGDPFRDWLVKILRNRIQNKACKVSVFKYSSASHTVCRYAFKGEDLSVIAKFFAEPTGSLRKYNPYKGMLNEYQNLEKAASVIDVARPIAINKDFHCVLVTEYIPGKALSWYLKHETRLYERLSGVAGLLRKLHTRTISSYDKKKEFSNFHEILDQLRLEQKTREDFNQLLGKWWYSPLLDRDWGCMLHRDVHPANYIFRKGKPYALDFESSWQHGNPIRDLGILSAELKTYFERQKGGDFKAEPYIGHFLWEYSENEAEFRQITEILPFYMSVGLLRSARLHRSEYRKYLIQEAIACLKAIL